MREVRKSSEELKDLPSDVIEDLLVALREAGERPRRRAKMRYPSNGDIARAIKTLGASASIKPQEFPDTVREYLEAQGFYTGLVRDERVWRLYEALVRKGIIRDFLGVVGESP